MKVRLGKKVVVQAEKTVSELTIKRIVDLPDRKVVRVFTTELSRPIIVMEGEGYGEWTKTDIVALLAEKV